MRGLEKDDCSLIGFVKSAVFYEAISMAELRSWAQEMVAEHDDLPTYMYEICDFNGYLGDLVTIIGFSPYWAASEDEKSALFGVAYRRGITPFDCPLNKDEALAKLIENPRCERIFRETFPFIEF